MLTETSSEAKENREILEEGNKKRSMLEEHNLESVEFDVELLITELNFHTVINVNTYNLLLQGRVEKIVTIHSGSLAMQKAIDKMTEECLLSVFSEIKFRFIELLKHTYANYFCQTLFVKLTNDLKQEIIICILDNLDSLLKHLISFKSMICLFETVIDEKTQVYATMILKAIPKDVYLKHTRYLKMLEAFVSTISEEKLGFAIELVFSNIVILSQSKQGFFLGRKIIKYSKLAQNQLVIVGFMIQNMNELLRHINGVLLAQCILKYFIKLKTYSSSKNTRSKLSFSKKIHLKSQLTTCKDISNDSDSLFHEFDQLKIDHSPVMNFFKVYFLEFLSMFSIYDLNFEIKKQHKKLLDLYFSNYKQESYSMLTKIFEEIDVKMKIFLVNELLNFYGGTHLFEEWLKHDINDNDKVLKLLTTIEVGKFPRKYANGWKHMIFNFKSLKNNHNKTRSVEEGFCNKFNIDMKSSVRKISCQIETINDESISNDFEFSGFERQNKTIFGNSDFNQNFSKIKPSPSPEDGIISKTTNKRAQNARRNNTNKLNNIANTVSQQPSYLIAGSQAYIIGGNYYQVYQPYLSIVNNSQFLYPYPVYAPKKQHMSYNHNINK